MAASEQGGTKSKAKFHAYPAWAPRFWHGMRIGGLLSLLVRNRFSVAIVRMPMVFLLLLITPWNDLLYFIQTLRFGRRIKEAQLKAPPLFVVGHWRSGTTLLHELLSLDERWASPSTYQCFAPWHFLETEWWMTRFGNFLMPDKRPMDNMKAGWMLPQEDEFAMMNLGCDSPYLRIAFPKRGPVFQELLDGSSVSDEQWKPFAEKFTWFLKTLTVRHDKPLILKSPTHTGRLGRFHDMFPGSLFIHISRDPRKLFPSTVRLWESLDNVQGLQYPVSDQEYEDLVLDSFQRMYNGYFAYRDKIPASQLIEIRYEDLVADPIHHLEQLYQKLGWDGFESMRPTLESRMQQDRDYQVNRHSMSAEQESKVRSVCEKYMRLYGYWEST
jgi:LPS sulfotransferase NodH